MLSLPYNHPAVNELRQKWRINRNRGHHAELTRCKAVELINHHQWQCSVEFVLGISADVNIVGTLNNDLVLPPTIELHTESCKQCSKSYSLNDVSRKNLRPTYKFCSPGCRSKYYRKPK